MEIVYHASRRQGETRFVPRRFWHSPDFGRSGRLNHDAEPPEGTSAIFAFYATFLESLPFYFFPPEVRRIGLQKGKHRDFDAALRLLDLPEVATDRLFLIQNSDAARLRSHRFSIYTFDAVYFRRVPTGEYLAEAAVTPIAETRYEDAFAAIREHGIQVVFVDDLDAAYRRLIAAEIGFDSQGGFDTS